MTRTAFRKIAEDVARSRIASAWKRNASLKQLRKELRIAFRMLLETSLAVLPKQPRSVWYAAVRTVAGCGVLRLPDPRQAPLPMDLGPVTRRPRRRRETNAR